MASMTASRPTAALIEVSGLTKDYGAGRGIFDLSFDVAEGEVFGFLGSNGAGKTVTMRHLMGFIRPQAGSARIFGMDCFTQRAAIQGQLGYLPGEIAIYDDMRAGDYLKLIASMRGQGSTKRRDELIERFELDPRMKVRKMSKGNKQKVGLVCAFMGSPRLLLLDEPTSGLDPLMQARFIELVREEQQRGATVLLSSHIFEEVERCCSRVAFIRQGRLCSVQDMTEVKGSRRHAFNVRFAREDECARFLEQHGEACTAQRTGACELELAADGKVDVLVKLLSGYEIEALSTREQSLEEMFMGFYGEGGAR